jgi:uncharacterized OB-fold protein
VTAKTNEVHDTDDAKVEPLTILGQWDFRYEYFAGEAASRFFGALAEKKIMGTVCPKCERTLVPARSFCDVCFVETTQWREVGTSGRLETFTILASKFYGLPDPPVVLAYVTLDGADTAILNFLTGLDLDDLDVAGAALLAQPRVEVRFDEHPQGRITDFHFVVVS